MIFFSNPLGSFLLILLNTVLELYCAFNNKSVSMHINAVTAYHERISAYFSISLSLSWRIFINVNKNNVKLAEQALLLNETLKNINAVNAYH